MLNLKSDSAKLERILIAGPILYFPWYWILDYLLPGTWNSFGLRAFVCLWAVAVFGFAKKFPLKTKIIDLLFQALLFIVMAHHFILAYANADRVEYRYLYFVITVLMASLATSVRSYVFLVGSALLLKSSLVFLPSAIIQFELFESSLWFCVFVFIGILVKSNIDAQKELVQLGLKTAENFKMIGLGQMSAGMAHEINNPLAIISGRAQFAVRKLKLNKDVDTISGDLETILKNTNRITKIIRSLGAFSQSTEAEPMIPVSINKIVNATVETCQAKMRSYAIELRWRSNQDFYVRGHFDQLCQVIMALLQNSMDAVVQQSNAWISIEAKEVQGRVHLVIQDSGAGIPAAIADKIMDPFFTTKEVGKGTGLGLSIVRGIVEAHAGEIYLDRNQKNTTFIIELAKVKPISIPVKEVA